MVDSKPDERGHYFEDFVANRIVKFCIEPNSRQRPCKIYPTIPAHDFTPPLTIFCIIALAKKGKSNQLNRDITNRLIEISLA